MKVAVFSSKPYDREALESANRGRHQLVFFEDRLRAQTVGLLEGFAAACLFVHDEADATVLEACARHGVGLIALRCAGHNNVDLAAARTLGIRVVRVPEYSPHGVAEFAVGMLLTLNRKYHRAYQRTRDFNFSLDGLRGFDLAGKTAGVAGTGKIGAIVARILLAFGCRVLACDPFPRADLEAAGVEYRAWEDLLGAVDVLTLHCPLTPETHHLLRRESFARLRDGVVLVNTSRGGLIETSALLEALRQGRLGAVGLDVYEEEEGVFFEDLSQSLLSNDELRILVSYPNVLVTSHQGFFTTEALREIADCTLGSLDAFAEGRELALAVA